VQELGASWVRVCLQDWYGVVCNYAWSTRSRCECQQGWRLGWCRVQQGQQYSCCCLLAKLMDCCALLF
jgi:hypothetical protein